MNQNSGGLSCVLGCWLIALLGGVLVAILFMLFGLSFVLAAFIGLLVLLAGGLFLSWKFCEDLPATDTSAANISMPEESVEQSDVSVSQSITAEAIVAPAPLMDSPLAHAEPEQPADEKPAAKKPAAKKTTTAKKPAAKAPAKKAAVASGDGPEVLSKPREGGADDLKLISGVGPALEKTLNELGFWHFDQVASWKKKDIEWVDSRLKFKGRIERDDWVKQANALAEGAQ